MKEKLEEMLATLEEHLPDNFEVAAMVREPDLASIPEEKYGTAGDIENVAYAIGYLQGAADQEGCTIVELLEANDVDVPALPEDEEADE